VLVGVQASRRVKSHRVRAAVRQRAHSVAYDRDRIRLVIAVDGNLDLAAELLELVDRRRSLEIRSDEARAPPFLAEEQRELGGGGRLPGALKSRQQDHRRGTSGERELRAAGAHERGQLLV